LQQQSSSGRAALPRAGVALQRCTQAAAAAAAAAALLLLLRCRLRAGRVGG
jgi:hypothetical protein